MKTKNIAAITSLIILIVLVGCSKDDEQQDCRDPSITMVVNGELQTFQVLGYGIDLEGNGHRLELYFHRFQAEPYLEQSGFVTLRFKETGANIIEKIYWHQSVDGYTFDAEISQSVIQSYVETNNAWCFYGTFSAVFNDGNQQINVTDAKLSYIYNEPMN